ncbi:phospho-sugar mutase [Carnobacterium maltaromaticum]|uniref:phospho-sugar mutase n=1 Tax=Carnobacterium maltaromaticum TaxID=2751 RepID=UPI00295EC81B|nr:phospho-sugar mutase [Carnobacterium maltaromaticum]
MKVLELRDTWLKMDDLDENMKLQLKKATMNELDDLFYQNVPFGTGGMRGIIGPGTNRINVATIGRATAGFGVYLKERYQGEINVVIGYDNRHYSKEFAYHAAEILINLGITASVFKKLTATPIVSYTIRELKAQAGIMITASHNPPEYNGFKIYDETGCQLLPQEAQKVVDQIERTKLSQSKNKLGKEPIDLGDEFEIAYLNDLSPLVSQNERIKNLSIGFSPQHGTALEPVKKMFEKYGYANCTYVSEQSTVDGDFSGTKSANPEDVQAFDLLKKYGERYQLELLVTTDPDADRVGVAYRNRVGKYVNMTGNQVGALLTDYYVKKKELTPQSYLIKTIVTSDLGAEIARKNGVEIVNVLTGFKYIGNAINQKGSDNFLLGYEESYGYLVEPITRDKDGIQIVLAIAEIANVAKEHDKNLGDVLEKIYHENGYYLEDLISIQLPGKSGYQQIQQIYESYKRVNWNEIAYGEDFEELVRIDYKTGLKEPFNFEQAQVFKLTFKDGNWLCIRPSGTEPKLKIYFGVKKESYQEATKAMQWLRSKIEKLHKELIGK